MQSTPDRKTRRDAVALRVKGRGLKWTPDLQFVLDRSLKRITERFPQLVRSIAASLEDVNGPRGGVDKRCAISLAIAGKRRVSVSACASNAAAAVIQAARRARNALIRTMPGTQSGRLRNSHNESEK